jgi:cob(I)alamin adenosyltransferase
MNRGGKIRVITGEGKGKTTAAVGFGWQAVSRGRRVLMIQFLKAPESSGEQFAAQAFGSQFTMKSMGRKGFIYRGGQQPRDRALARGALEEARKAIESGGFDMIILDEVNVAVHLGLLNIQEVVALLDSRPKNLDMVLTGRDAHKEVIKRADSVLAMNKIKHHFDAGVPAREGVEY